MAYDRIFNFSAGPAILPESVLEIVRDNILNYENSGMGVMELSHRGSHFKSIIETAEDNLRKLLSVDNDYAIIFCTGGATQQFSMLPMNLANSEAGPASYIVTGSWSKKALAEAKRFTETKSVASSEDRNFAYIPTELDLPAKSSYVHFTSNNTIFGTQFSQEPEIGGAPILCCDASSDLLHKKIDVSKYGLIYAGAQKNLGPAGVTIVIVRKDLLTRCPDTLPKMMDYRTFVEGKSLSNTPPTFPIYVVGEILKWIKNVGGLSKVEENNRSKSDLLYKFIDESDLFTGTAEKESRSMMNVTFKMKNEMLEEEFLKMAVDCGFQGLKGHRSVGGFRASIYNSFPKEGVVSLVNFLQQFEEAHS